MADVSAKAGVSMSTVSLVLNGKAKKHRISDKTAQRVREVAKELRYVPNDVARWLRNQQTGDVGVILPHLRNNWADQVMAGIEDVLDEHGLIPLIVHHRDDEERSRRGLESLVQRRVRGVICNPTVGSADHFQSVIDRRIPLVFISDLPTDMPDGTVATWDPEEIGLLIEHVLESGRSRVCVVDYADLQPVNRARIEAADRMFERHGIRPAARFEIDPDQDRERLAQHVADRFKAPPGQRPDALFTLYDNVALEAIKVLNGLGLRVPEDVMVAATGTGISASTEVSGMTLMVAPVSDEGAIAARLLMERVEDPDLPHERRPARGGRVLRLDARRPA